MLSLVIINHHTNLCTLNRLRTNHIKYLSPSSPLPSTARPIGNTGTPGPNEANMLTTQFVKGDTGTTSILRGRQQPSTAVTSLETSSYPVHHAAVSTYTMAPLITSWASIKLPCTCRIHRDQPLSRWNQTCPCTLHTHTTTYASPLPPCRFTPTYRSSGERGYKAPR